MTKKYSMLQMGTALVIALIVITALVIGVFWTKDIVGFYKQSQEETAAGFVADSQLIMEEKVSGIISHAESQRASTEDVLKANIKDRTYEALSIAQNIYEINKGKLTEDQIKKQIKDALRPIRFNQGRGYYFAVSMDGYEELYPVFEEFEGKYVLELQDEKGNYVIKDEIKVIKSQGEGYVTDYWKKPGLEDGLIYPKISFVTYFEPLNWYIGTGEYIDDVEQDIKNSILEEATKIRYGVNNENYIFVTNFDGIEIANGKYPKIVGTSIKELVDKDGTEIFKQELTAVKENPKGKFLYHSWFGDEKKELNTETITFVRGFDEWGWIVGTSVDTDEMVSEIASLQQELKQEVKNQILSVIITLLFIVVIAIAVLRRVFKIFNRTLNSFNEFFQRSAKEHQEMDLNEVNFKELKLLAKAANEMISERRGIYNHVQMLSVTDGMTGTYNHQYILEKLEQEISLGRGPISVVMFDVDDFKQINDVFGHLAGDDALKKIAEVIKTTARGYDLVGRYGGEEFLVLLTNADLGVAKEVAERIRERVATLDLPLGSQIQVSGGVAQFINGETAEQLVKRADDAMYQAKRQGKNRIIS